MRLFLRFSNTVCHLVELLLPIVLSVLMMTYASSLQEKTSLTSVYFSGTLYMPYTRNM